GRWTHCMRWLGVARRAIDVATRRAAVREAFGKRLAEHQGVQWQIADSAMELHACRLMIWHAAWLIDQGHHARHETSMAKTFVAEAVNRVVYRAVQVCGSLGIGEGPPRGRVYRNIRRSRG